MSVSKTLVGWGLAQSGTSLARGHGVILRIAWALEFAIRLDVLATDYHEQNSSYSTP